MAGAGEIEGGDCVDPIIIDADLDYRPDEKQADAEQSGAEEPLAGQQSNGTFSTFRRHAHFFVSST
jgi:hypothetical protein